jgi:hypothetical protein
MPTFWDLLPASLWPTQPFIPPVNPGQGSDWPQGQAVSSQPATPMPNFPPPDALASSASWDDNRYQQMLADAKRASDFVNWMFAPPRDGSRPLMAGAARSTPTLKDLATTSVSQDSFNDRWPGPFDFGTSPAPPMVRSPFFPAPQDDPQYPFSNPPGSPAIPDQGPQTAPPAPSPRGDGAPPQRPDTLSPEQRAQHCVLDPAEIAANLGNRLQPFIGKTHSLTGQVITQEWINRQAAEMQKTIEQIQKELGCPSEMY